MEYGESNLTTSPVCPQERFSLYKFGPLAYPLLKRIGLLAAPQHHLLSLLLFPCCLYPKTHKKLPFSTCSYSLSKITCHYLLILVGFDTLTYLKGYDRSPTLVGHQLHADNIDLPDEHTVDNQEPRRLACILGGALMPLTIRSFKLLARAVNAVLLNPEAS